MRLFIAIEIPLEIKNSVVKITQKLKLIKGVRIVKQENIHLTLYFLGDIRDIRAVVKKLNTIKFSAFDVVVEGAGFFSNNNNIKVAWLGIKKNKNLEDLQKKIHSLFGPKKKYVPHLTIARIGFISESDKQKIKEIMAVERKSMIFKVDKFRLYSSELTPLGSVHRVVESFVATE